MLKKMLNETIQTVAKRSLAERHFCTLPKSVNIKVFGADEARPIIINEGDFTHIACCRAGVANLKECLAERQQELTDDLVEVHTALKQIEEHLGGAGRAKSGFH